MPAVRVKQARALNAKVSLSLTLNDAEATQLLKEFPGEKRNVALNTLVMNLLETHFTQKKSK